jgi:hypothetical protein
MTRRSRDEIGLRVPLGTVRIVLAVVAALLAVAVIVGFAALARANEPVTVATSAQLKVQQAAAERDVERAYEQSATQVTKVRALNLAITAAQADQIAAKALTDLRTLRHSAFVQLGQIMGMSATEADAYSTASETRFDAAPVSKQTASPSPVLLAPRLYSVIVSRMSELATLIADQATTQLTAPPPSASPTPSASPSATPRPSASPSPTRP